MALLAIGMPVVGHVAVAGDASPETLRGQRACRIEQWVGGAICDAALANKRVASDEPHVCAIVGADESGKVVADRLGSQFAHLHIIQTADVTRGSCTVPGAGGRADGRAFANRPRLDHDATLAALDRLLDTSDIDQVLIGAMDNADHPVAEHVLLRAADEPGLTSYFVPTGSRCRPRPALLRLAELADWTQLSLDALEELSGQNGVVAGINWFREQIRTDQAIVVTCGRDGVYGFDGANWHYQSALQVQRQQVAAEAAEVTAGTLLAWLATSSDADLGQGLRLAASAVAMHLGCQPRTGGWAELEAVASTCPSLPFQLPVGKRQGAARVRIPSLKRLAYAAGAAAAVTVSAVMLL